VRAARHLPTIALLGVLALAAGHPAAVADRAGADAAAKRGELDLRSRRWTRARKEFEQALAEDEAHLAARLGWAEAALAAGDRTAALEALRRVAEGDGSGAALPPEWAGVPEKAKTRIAEIEQAGRSLESVLQRRADALLELASRWRKDDPELAARVASAGLRLSPEDARLLEVVRDLGAGPEAGWTPIFDGKDLTGFRPIEPGLFRLENGLLVGGVENATYLTITEQTLQGDFDVRVEVRLKHPPGPKTYFLVAGAQPNVYVGTQAGFGEGDFLIREADREAQVPQSYPYRKPISEVRATFDATTWNTYELQFRGSTVRFLLNGSLVVEHAREPARVKGNAGFLIQNALIELRRMEVRQR
jgi:tetratricopeptide (TPR) repeat protein